MILLPSYDKFARVVHSHIAEVPAIFIDVDGRMKGVLIRDHEIKQ